MLLFLGFIGIIQAIFLPGFIAIKILKIDWQKNPLRLVILSFGLSLIINFYLVFIATVLRFSNSYFYYGVIILEIFYFIFSSKNIFALLKISPLKKLEEGYYQALSFLKSQDGVFNILLFLLIPIVLLHLYYFFSNAGEVFSGQDAVFSWNRWAVDWANYKLPSITWYYPQLIPAIWGLIYLIIGNSDIQLFSKFIMPFFSLILLLAIIDLGLTFKKKYFLLGAIITFLLIRLVVNPSHLVDGYVDIAVTCLSLLSIYSLLLSRRMKTGKQIFLYVIIGAILAASAGLIKQAGLFIVIIYPVLAYFLVIKNKYNNKKKIILATLIIIGILILLISPWYVYKEIQIKQSVESSNIQYLIEDIHNGKNYIERATLIFLNSNYRFLLVLLFISTLVLIKKKNTEWRTIQLIYTIPFFLIWLFLFSYDYRNSVIILPLIGIASAIILIPVTELAYKVIKKIRIYQIVIILMIVFILLGWKVKDQFIISYNLEQIKKTGSSELNVYLYDYFSDNELEKILTNYNYLCFLPSLKDACLYVHHRVPDSFESSMGLEEVKYILVTPHSNSDIILYLGELAGRGEIQLLYDYDNYQFYKK